MKLNHLNLTVTDPLETHDFLEKYFGLKSMGGNKNMAFLRDDAGAVVSLTSLKVAKETEILYANVFHIGFMQEDAAKVDEINARLRGDGFDVPPPSRQHGSWTFYFEAPGGFTIEVLS